MDIYCLKNGVNQSDEERNAQFEDLRDSIAPGSETEGGGTADGTAEQRPQLQVALDLLASGSLESICFRSPGVLAQSVEEIAKLKSFLSEHEIGLTLTDVDSGPDTADGDHGRGGADANDVHEVESA